MEEPNLLPVSIDELRGMEFPPEHYIISHGLLGVNGIILIGGPPKSFKSFIVQEMMLALATGTPVFNANRHHANREEVIFNVTEPKRVLFLEQEIGLYDVKNRIMPAVATFSEEHQKLIGQNLFVLSRDHTMRLDTDDGVKRISNLIKHCKPQVVVFDPLIEFHTSDESNAQEMGKVMWHLSMLQNVHEFAAIVTHHTSKPNQNHRDGPDKLRGSSVIFGKGDSFLMLEPGNRNHSRVKIEFTFRRAIPPAPMWVKLDRETQRAQFNGWVVGKNDNSRD